MEEHKSLQKDSENTSVENMEKPNRGENFTGKEESDDSNSSEKSQEEYSFMQEVIKDEADSAGKLKSSIFRVIGYGAVFGLAASFVFSALTPWVETHFTGSSNQVEIPSDESGGEKQPAEETSEEDSKKESETDAYRQVLQSLAVTASEAKSSLAVISKKKSAAGEEEKNSEQRSGVVIADNGREFLVLSKSIKVKDSEVLEVTFSDRKSYAVTLKKQDANLGIGIYAVDKKEIDKDTAGKITVAELGNSHLVESGDSVIVLGKPFGTDDAVSYGVVTADEKYVEKADGHYRLLCTNINEDGNGSGVFLNKKGQVVGLIDQSAPEEGSGCIGGYGISDMKDVIELLSNGSSIPYTGIYGMDVTDNLAKNGMPQGVYVKEVAADSPAMEAGIQSGDVIVGIDGENIESLSNYHSILMRQTEGSEIELQGCRQGANEEYVQLVFKVKVSARE